MKMAPFPSVKTTAAIALPNSGDRPHPLVSVVICNYNYGRYLPQAIDSVLNQTYPNYELIVVDDGSVDNSRVVIEGYGTRLTPIFQKNSGQGPALGAGVEQAKGTYICFLDADDYYHPEKLAKVVAAFQEHPTWVQVAHGWISVDQDSQPTGRNLARRLSRGDVRRLLLAWGRYSWGITSSLAYRRDALLWAFPLPKRPRAADAYLTATVPFFGEVGSIDQPLMYYRIHGKNRRAHSNNMPYLLEQREDTCACINRAAERVGIEERFQLQRDSDYQCYKVLVEGGVPLGKGLPILWLTLMQSMALGRNGLELTVRMVERAICVLLPSSQGLKLLSLGLRGYVRSLFVSKPQ